MQIINEYEFNLNNIFTKEQKDELYRCKDKNLIDYFIKEKLISIDYEYLKHYEELDIKLPLCEYYVRKGYHDLLEILNKEIYPDQLKINLLWAYIENAAIEVNMDDDEIIRMIESVPDKYYDEYSCEVIASTLESYLREYLPGVIRLHIASQRKNSDKMNIC